MVSKKKAKKEAAYDMLCHLVDTEMENMIVRSRVKDNRIWEELK